MPAVSTFTHSCLVMQGFSRASVEARPGLAMTLRFTPAVCATLALAGLLLGSPVWLAGMAVVALIGVLLPSGHPIDLLFNHGVRHLVGAEPLPPNPAPRRFACGVGLVMLSSAALAFATGHPVLAWALGGFLVVVAAFNTLTNWCLASWFYGLMFKRTQLA